MTLLALNTLKHRQDPAVLMEIDVVKTVNIDTSLTPWGVLGGLFSQQPYNVARFWSDEFAALLTKALKEGDFDLVQLEGSYMSIYLPTIRAATSIPIVLRSHNVEFQIWQRLAASEKSSFKAWYIRDLSKKIRRFELEYLPKYDAIVPIADLDEDFYRENGFQKPIRTVNGGVDLTKFAPTKAIAFDQEFLFLGSLEWQPNVQGLMWFLENVWPAIHEKFPNATFHVAGKNPPEWLQKLEIQGMKFYGMVEDAAQFLNSGHFLIVPLLSGGGMRLKIVEAMANGKCIVSTKIGAEGIASQDGKDIVIADEAEVWIKKIDHLLQHPQESVAIAENALQLAIEKYGWDAIVADLVDFYRSEVLK